MNRTPDQPPVLSDSASLHARLDAEERQIIEHLRSCERIVRNFEDRDVPAYQTWLRREFGPLLSAIEQMVAQVRAKQSLLQRVEQILEEGSLQSREALYEALHGGVPIEDEERLARKRAKLETKRELRREAKKNKRKTERDLTASSAGHSRSPGKKILNLYRHLARRLHPDATRAVGATAELHQRIWLEVQAAYESSDLHRLLSLASWLDSGSEEHAHSGARMPSHSFSERYEALRALKRSLAQTERKALELRERPEWDFLARSSTAVRYALKRDIRLELEENLAHAEETLAACEEAIRSIGPARPARIRPEQHRQRKR